MILRLLLEVSHTHRELQHLTLLKRDRVKQIMARLQVLEFPDPRLRTKAQPVTDVSTTTHEIVQDMF